MNDTNTKCAHGRVGYDIDSGKAYTPKPACPNDARPGHILCESCRTAVYGLKR